MKERIEVITHLAEVLYSETKGKYTVSIETVKTWQMIVDDIQEQIDSISNELYKPDR